MSPLNNMDPAPSKANSTSDSTKAVHDGNASSHSSRSSLKGTRRGSSRSLRRASSLFAAARASFYRSKGDRGASVETLRGSKGADFESYATVHRGDAEGLMDMFDITTCFGCCGKKDGVYFLLIKGEYCFVFVSEDSASPKYAIELINRRAVVDTHESYTPRIPHPGASNDTTYTSINLETSIGDIEYKFTFANMDDTAATRFCNAIAVASSEAATEQTRKRLGHANLLDKRGSVRYANQLGEKKKKDQPEAPVTAGEVMAGMPAATGY